MKDYLTSILNTSELYTSSSRIHDAIMKALPSDTYSVPVCGKLKGGLTDMEKALGRALNSEFTSVLKEDDTGRDHSFIGLRDHVSAFTHHKDTAKAAAAKSLAVIIANAGNSLYSLGNAAETTKLNTLIVNLSTPESKLALETIGATEWFNELVSDQKKFEETYQEKTDVEGAINYPLLKNAKLIVLKNVRALLSYVETNSSMNVSPYPTLEEKLDEIITDILTIAHARITREENEKKNATGNTSNSAQK
jgi:hypothetical protein